MIACGVALWFCTAVASRMEGREDVKAPVKAPDGGALPFTPVVGSYYQIFMPDWREWPGVRSPVLIQKAYSNGWVEVKTPENQIAWINLNQATQLYRIEDIKKFRKLAGLDKDSDR